MGYLVAMHRKPVLVREQGDGLHGQLVGGAEDADGDLAAVGDHDLLEDIVWMACGGSADGIDRVFLLVHHGCVCVMWEWGLRSGGDVVKRDEKSTETGGLAKLQR